MRIKQFSDEVLFVEERIVKVGHRDIEILKERATRNRRKQIRLCAHKDVEDRLHEMLIVKTRDTYTRPHKNLKKNKSFHIVEGSVHLIIFDELGNIVEVIQMGDYSSGHIFYYRMSEPGYHTLLIGSDFLVFYETTNGPFKSSDTIFAPWAPDENDIVARKEFVKHLERATEKSVHLQENI